MYISVVRLIKGSARASVQFPGTVGLWKKRLVATLHHIHTLHQHTMKPELFFSFPHFFFFSVLSAQIQTVSDLLSLSRPPRLSFFFTDLSFCIVCGSFFVA